MRPSSSLSAGIALWFGLFIVALGCSPDVDDTDSASASSSELGSTHPISPNPTGDNPKRASHLLLITVDTLRADRLGSYGYEAASTPAMDRLASEGTRMSHALSHVPMTLPSHASLMTGRLPIHTGVRNNGTYVLAEDELTLAERLKTEGFSTGAALGAFVLLKKFGLAQGFDLYDDTLSGDDILRAFNTEIPADLVLAKWRRWLSDTSPTTYSGEDERFFYWAHFYDPHLPYQPPEPFRAQFEASPYDGEVAFVDQQIGEMLADLEARDLLDSTLVVLTSDHGESFGEHGETGHGLTAYRPALHVPLILRGPGVAAARKIDARVGLSDLLPTLLELLDLDLSNPPELELDGQSFVELIQGKSEPSPRTVYFETLLGQEDRNWAPLTGLYSGDRKLISLPRPELYSAERDALEQDNLVSAERRVYRRLDEQLRALLLGTSSDDGRRELTDEDAEKLQSLGYVSSGGKGSGTALDPKDGLLLDQQLREIETILADQQVDRAEEQLSALRRTYADQVLPSFFLFEHRIAVQKQQADLAISALQRGTAALPEVYPLRYELARYLIDQQKLEQAADVSQSLVSQHPGLSQGWILLGRSLEAIDPEGAFKAYGRARELEPNNLNLAERMADFYVRRGNLDGALSLLDDLIRRGLYDDRAQGLFKAAMLHLRRGTSQEAERLFAHGLSLKPQGFFYMSYAMVLERNAKRDEAIVALTQALESKELTPEQAKLARSTLARWQS